MLRAASFALTPALEAYVKDLFSVVGQSKICEDGMHFERRGEGEQDSKLMTIDRRWSTLVDHKILSREHRYDEIEWMSASVPRGVAASGLNGLYGEKRKDASMDFKSIVGYGRTDYHNPSTETELRSTADIQLALHCFEKQDWAKSQTSWLALLARVPRLCVKGPSPGDRWHFALGDLGGSVALAWPALRMVGSDGSECFAPAGSIPSEDLQLLVISDLAGWSGVKYKWCSPARMHNLGFSGQLVAAQVVGQQESLASCCARAAFGPTCTKEHYQRSPAAGGGGASQLPTLSFRLGLSACSCVALLQNPGTL